LRDCCVARLCDCSVACKVGVQYSVLGKPKYTETLSATVPQNDVKRELERGTLYRLLKYIGLLSKGCVNVALQGCVIVALQGCVIVLLRAKWRDCAMLILKISAT
jgi:hypothetical protein